MGLVGQAIAKSLISRSGYLPTPLPYTWGDHEHQAEQVKAILAFAGQDGPVDVIWAAGRSGFGSTETEMLDELSELSRVLGPAGLLCPLFKDGETVFHLIGSAGGLFEGQGTVGYDTPPVPKRPYGFGKLEQEALLQSAVAQGRIAAGRVYRASTVYGFALGGRAGLITTVLRNAALRRETRIIGKPTTLRDYILADDIGAHIAGRIDQRQADFGTEFLVSGRPSAMEEVLHTAGRVIGAQIYRKYETQTYNDQDISFLGSCRPADLITTQLETGIQLVAQQMRDCHAIFGHRL